MILDPLASDMRQPDISPVLPDEVFITAGHFASLPQYQIDSFYKIRGVLFVEVSSSRASVFDPPDATVFRVDFTVDGAPVLTEVSWLDGSKS